MKRKPITLAILAALASPFAGAADGGEQSLPEITVSRPRPTVVADNPSPQAQVTQEQLREINVINVEDAVKYLPSLHIRKRYIGDRNSIVQSRSNGTIQSARSLVYADGLLLSNLLGNSFAYPPRWSLVGAEEIESMEVLYGPFSALLPGNSAGATILMTTRRPERFEAHARAQVFSQHYRLYGTDDTFGGHQEQATLGGRAGKLSWSVLASHLDSHGQPMSFANSTTPAAPGAGVAVSGAHRDRDPADLNRVVFGATSIDHSVQDVAKLRLAYDFTPDTRAAFTLAHWRVDSYSDSQTYLRNAAGNPIWSGGVFVNGVRYFLPASSFAPTDRNEENRLLGLSLDSRLNADWRVEAVLSRYDTLEDVSRTPTTTVAGGLGQPGSTGGAGRMTFQDGTGWSTADLRAVWKAAAAHTVTFGYHYDQYRYRNEILNATQWQDDGSTTTLYSANRGNTETQAWFVQDVWKPDPRWTLTVGWRHERWRAHDGVNVQSAAAAAPAPAINRLYAARDERFNSPKLSLAWLATPDWQLRGSLARAWRMPTVTELFQSTRSGAVWYDGDPNLKPEKVLAKDLTAEGAAGGGLLRASLFEDLVADALQSQLNTTVTPNITNVQNVDRMRVRGIETAWQAGDVLLRGLDLTVSLTYAASKVLANDNNPASVGKRVLRVPDWRATLFAAYRIDERWSASLGIRYSGRQYNTINNSDVNFDVFGATSKFLVADARLSYRFGKLLRASFGVDNLGNQKYYAFHPYPQRTYHAELRLDY